MKISTEFSAMVLRSIETKSKDGKSTYYKLSLEDVMTGEAGTISCTEDVASRVERFKDYRCYADYNTDYNSFRIVSVVEIGGSPIMRTADPAKAAVPDNVPAELKASGKTGK